MRRRAAAPMSAPRRSDSANSERPCLRAASFCMVATHRALRPDGDCFSWVLNQPRSARALRELMEVPDDMSEPLEEEPVMPVEPDVPELVVLDVSLPVVEPMVLPVVPVPVAPMLDEPVVPEPLMLEPVALEPVVPEPLMPVLPAPIVDVLPLVLLGVLVVLPLLAAVPDVLPVDCDEALVPPPDEPEPPEPPDCA